jgi:predicted RND superfamily exporter protein
MKRNNLKIWSIIALAFIFVITGVGTYSARNITVDYNYENYFPQQDSSLKSYKEFVQNFGADGEFILIGLKNKDGIFDSTFLRKIQSLGNELKLKNNVNYLISPCHECFSHKMAGLATFEKKPCISFESFIKDSVKIYQNKKLIGSIFSANGKAVTIYLSTPNKLNKKSGDKLLSDINSTLEKYNFDELHISGRIIATSYYTEKLEDELILFFCISTALVCLFLWYSFKSLWGVVVPITIVIFSMIWTVVIMKLAGKDFDLLMVMLPTIVFVVGMSDLVHFLSRFLDELRAGQRKLQAIKISFKEVGLATFLTSSTTSIGFFSLTIVEITPVKEFGIYSGISVIVAYVLTFIMLPLFLIILPPPNKLLKGKRKERWELLLSRCFEFIFNHKKIIYISILSITILSLLGISQLSTNNYLLEDLKENDPVKKDYRFFEQNFSGVRPFELELTVGPNGNNIYDFKSAIEIQKIEKYLETQYTPKGVGFIISPLDPIKYLYAVKHNNNPDYYRLPAKEKTYLNQLHMLHKLNPSSAISLVSSDSNKVRLSGKIDDLGGLIIRKENEKFMRFVLDSVNTSLITAQLTGAALLIDKTNENLSSNILLGLLLAFTVIAIIIGLVYKTWIVVVITMLVNTLPLIMIGGIMNLLNLDIKVSTTLIFTLAFGIAVDDTIHMLSRLKLLLRRGMPLMEALKTSYLSTGKAIIVTSLILCSGFLSLTFSTFVSMQTMGFLISITLLIAVIVDLTVLPLLLAAFKSKIKEG